MTTWSPDDIITNDERQWPPYYLARAPAARGHHVTSELCVDESACSVLHPFQQCANVMPQQIRLCLKSANLRQGVQPQIKHYRSLTHSLLRLTS